MEKTPRGTWENAFPGIASSPAAQSSAPSKAGILRGRIPASFRSSTFQTKARKLFIIINNYLRKVRNYSQPLPEFFPNFFAILKQPSTTPLPHQRTGTLHHYHPHNYPPTC